LALVFIVAVADVPVPLSPLAYAGVFRPTTLKQKEPPALTLPAAEETITIEPKVINFCGKVFTIKKGKTITKKFETPERAKINGK